MSTRRCTVDSKKNSKYVNDMIFFTFHSKFFLKINVKQFINIFIDTLFKLTTKMMSGRFLTDEPCSAVGCLKKMRSKRIYNLNAFLHV